MNKKLLSLPLVLILLLASCSSKTPAQPITPANQPQTAIPTLLTTTSAVETVTGEPAPGSANQDLVLTRDSVAVSDTGGFTLTSPNVIEGGALPAEYTCDGASATLPLAWSSAPAGTKSFVVIMHHIAGPEDVHWYWVLYNIPADITSLQKNTIGIGTLGTNSVNGKTAYTPPCSKGPGPKTYIFTVYALSAQPQVSVPVSQVDRSTLLGAIQDITLASAELHLTYSRK